MNISSTGTILVGIVRSCLVTPLLLEKIKKMVGYIDGMRTSDEQRIRLGPFRGHDADCWQLVDISESYLLFYYPGEPFSLVVVNVVTNTFEMLGVPDDVSLDHGEYVIKIIAEAERMDDTTQEVDDRRNIILYNDEEDQLYTIFFKEGNDNISVYVRKFDDMQINEPHIVEEEEEVVPKLMNLILLKKK
nr:hypothetical protein [Tanacetum cinerariifolium]